MYETAQALVGIGLGVILILVGRMVANRDVDGPFERPHRMFVTWWRGIGAAWIIWAIDTLAIHWLPDSGILDVLDYGAILAYFLCVLVAFASLLHYLLFLYFGSPRLSGAVWALYGLLALVVVGLFVAANAPATFTATGIVDAIFGPYQTLADVIRIAMLLPVILASLALFLVVRKVEDPLRRYRVLMLSVSLALYFLAPLLIPSNPGVVPVDGWAWSREVANKLALAIAVGAAYFTYNPPSWVRRRFHVDGVKDDV